MFFLKYKIVFIVFIILYCFVFQINITLSNSENSVDNFSRYLEGIPKQNRINLLLDSARKYFNSDVVKSVYFCELAVANVDNTIIDSVKVELYSFTSRVYVFSGNYSKALEFSILQLKILERNPLINKVKILLCYVFIGETYRAATDYDNAILNIDNAIKILSSINNEESEKGLSYAYERLAAVYFEVGYQKSDTSNMNKAIQFSNMSINIANKYSLISRKINNWNIIGACMSNLNQYEESLNYFQKALQESKNDSTYTDISNIYNNIAGTYLLMENYDKAIEYGKLSYEESKKRGVLVYVREACSVLNKSYFAQKKYDLAFYYLNEFYTISYDLNNSEKTKAMNLLELKFQKEKSDIENERRNSRVILIISVTFFVFLVITLFFIYRQIILKRINKRLEEQNQIISKQKAELEEMNAAKNKFFSILAHDLRNPFNGILGFLSILKNDYETLSEKERIEYIGHVNTSANVVFKLLDRLLQLSRLQDGRYKFTPECINVKEIAQQIIHLQQTNAANKRVELILNVNDDVFAFADKASFDTVLRNIVDNGIKFTSAGGKVIIEASNINKDVVISITDEGVGMEQSDIANIFKLDKKTLSIGTNNEKGTGLGLFVSKEMIEKMGGKIFVESELGKGSKFVIVLPRKIV